ncbi:hypothetical protein ACQKP6_09125 [Pseudomonas fluorescens]|uniref:hypothetical protein n=1 Tax=Pseudomonas fluorescens TaxID=294 RepID=UPI003CFC274B
MNRRTYKPKRKEAHEPNASDNSRMPILLAVIAASVGVIGSGLTWFSSYQATKQAMTISCVARFDQQEKLIREKTENFLTNYGEFLSRSGNREMPREEKRPLVEKTVKGAMALVAYAPLELGTPTLGLVTSLIFAMDATDQKTVDQQAGLAGISMLKWSNQYFTLMDNFQSQRDKCFE